MFETSPTSQQLPRSPPPRTRNAAAAEPCAPVHGTLTLAHAVQVDHARYERDDGPRHEFDSRSEPKRQLVRPRPCPALIRQTSRPCNHTRTSRELCRSCQERTPTIRAQSLSATYIHACARATGAHRWPPVTAPCAPALHHRRVTSDSAPRRNTVSAPVFQTSVQ